MGQGSSPRKERKLPKPPELKADVIRPPERVVPGHHWRVLALCLVALAAYSNSFRTGLIFDNATIILQDTRIRALTPQNIGLILHNEYWHNSMTTGLYRPLTTVSYLINYS